MNAPLSLSPISILISIAYFIHLIATVVWLGGLLGTAVFALPAYRSGTLTKNTWVDWQRRLTLASNASLVILLITGFFQMTNDPLYAGFLVFDGVWAWAMLFKHLAYGGMIGITVYTQLKLHPEIKRLDLLNKKRATLAEAEQAALLNQEASLLRLNLILGGVVLLFTAIATAV